MLGFSWPIDITAAFARCAMSRIDEPDFAETRSTGFVAGGAIAICTEADALCFFAGSGVRETSIEGEAEASCGPCAACGATPSAEAAANRSLNITEGTVATASVFGTDAVACVRSPNTVVITAAGVLRAIELIWRVATGASTLTCTDG